MHDLLRRSAERHPDRPAVVDAEVTLSYGELDNRSTQLAHLLRQQGIGRGDRVALYLDKSANSVVGIYGALKAGAAYVPLDPAAPTRRLAYIAANCGVKALLTSVQKADRWEEVAAADDDLAVVVALDGTAPGPWDADDGAPVVLGQDALAASPLEPVDGATLDQDLAYILYTSGSTGDPKGVMLTHRNALAFVGWAVEEFGVSEDDRLSSHAPLHFDLSIFDIFAAAAAGAPVILVPARASLFPIEVARFIRSSEITVWYSVPSVLTMMTLRGGLEGGDFPKLRTLLFAGEVFPTKHLRALMALLPHVRFANLFGPTETNVCTWYDVVELPEQDSETIPIGRPIPNDEAIVVTDAGGLAVPGEPGELYIRGATVMRGYWGDGERTSRSLVPDPSRPDLPDLVYRTGDLVREDPQGNLRYLGRRDAQIKSRGYRIELGDIEAALNSHPSVVECVVVAVPDELVTNRIRGYVVAPGMTDRELARHCGDQIPKYMVPESIEVRDSLPKTSTGKLDRQAILEDARRASSRLR